MIEFECPSCNARARASDSDAGSQIECQGCGAVLEIPGLDDFADEPEVIGTPIDGAERETVVIGSGKSRGYSVEPETGASKTISVGAPSRGKARCARHTDRGADQTCERCGNFMCEVCTRRGDEDKCPACRQLVGGSGGGKFPFSRNRWTFGELVNHAWESYKREGLMLVVGYFLMFAIPYGIMFAGAMALAVVLPNLGMGRGPAGWFVVIPLFIGIYLAFIALLNLLLLGMHRMVMDALTGKSAEVGTLFSQFPKAFASLGQVLCIMLVYIVANIPLAIVAGVVISNSGRDAMALFQGIQFLYSIGLMFFLLPMYAAPIELANDDDVGVIESIQNSFRIFSGFRAQTFGVAMFCSFFAAVGMLACCVGILVTGPMAHLIFCGMYLALRNGSGLPAVRRH